MTEHQLKERTYGALFGYAIGDALGLGTEFMTAKEAAMRYLGGLRDYKDIIFDVHRMQWPKGAWTTDTEIILILLGRILETESIDIKALAAALKEWNDTDMPADIPSCMRWVFNHPEYLTDPARSVKETWQKLGDTESTNEALGRGLIAGIWSRAHEVNSEILTGVTHHDDACFCCAAIIARIVHDLFWDGKETHKEMLLEICNRLDPDVAATVELALDAPSVKDLRLDEHGKIWDVNKALSATLWTLHHTSSPEETLYAIVDAAGDADTNAALALGVAGIKYGFSALPSRLVDGLLYRDRVEEVARRLFEALRKRL